MTVRPSWAARRRCSRIPRSAAVVALAAIVGAGCAPTQTTAQDDDPGMLHVHALQADPSNGSALLAAAHTGLFRIDGQSTERISAEWHDLMAFTIAPDDVLLASGHPALDADHLRLPEHPPHLGLVRSTDDGRTWQSVSLLGEADFHALVASDEVLLGAEATTGRLLASTDGGDTWQERSPIDLITLAAHPGDTDLLVGTTGDGLVRSEDAGRTWTPTAGMTGPVAANTDGFVVAGPDGQVATSGDGTDWEPAGQLPSTPEALLALDDRLYAWTTGDGLQHSDNAGQTWQATSSIER